MERAGRGPVEATGLIATQLLHKSFTMNNNLQPLSEQQCKEINGGTSIGLGGIVVITGLTDLGVFLGNTLIAATATVTGVVVGVATVINRLLTGIRL